MSKQPFCTGRTQNGRITTTLAPAVAAKPYLLSGLAPNNIQAASYHPTMQAAISAAIGHHELGYTNQTIRDRRGGVSFPFSTEWAATQQATP